MTLTEREAELLRARLEASQSSMREAYAERDAFSAELASVRAVLAERCRELDRLRAKGAGVQRDLGFGVSLAGQPGEGLRRFVKA